jgi:hypothetical protein
VDAELRSRGLRTFIDVADSDAGQFWPQAQAAIHRCRAFVLICTNGSFETKQGDDWVLREVTEVTALGRPIVPVFSKDFKPPATLPPSLAQAIEYNGVSMDTQFHVAAFDHLSQLLGGRKRSEQRRRVAILGSLAVLTLLASLVVGAREISGLTEEFRRERDARQAAEAALEKSRADERRAAEQLQREADARSQQLARDLAELEKRRAEQLLADEKKRAEQLLADERRQREADAQRDELARDLTAAEQRRSEQILAAAAEAKRLAEQRRQACFSSCQVARNKCESACFIKTDSFSASGQQLREACNDSCKQNVPFCVANCQ